MGSYNQDLLFHLANQALRAAGGAQEHWALQRRHPDGRRWLEVGRFASREIARMALDAFVAGGQGDRDEFRVRKVRRQAPV